MRHNNVFYSRKQHGSMLIMVVFITVILALLVTAMGSLLSNSSQNTTVEVRATRALMAAQSGLEFAFYEINNNRAGTVDICASATQYKLKFTNDAGLEQCEVLVECHKLTVGNTYQITSEGQCGVALADMASSASQDISSDFAVSRTLQAQGQ